MPVISIRLNDNEEKLIKNFIESKGTTISQYIKDILMEKIEDEYDLAICEEYLKDKANGDLKLIPFEEAVKEWGV